MEHDDLPPTPPTLDEGVDELEDGLLISGREILDLPEAVADAGRLRRQFLLQRIDPEQLIGAAAERRARLDDQPAGWLNVAGIVVGNDAPRDGDRVVQVAGR